MCRLSCFRSEKPIQRQRPSTAKDQHHQQEDPKRALICDQAGGPFVEPRANIGSGKVVAGDVDQRLNKDEADHSDASEPGQKPQNDQHRQYELGPGSCNDYQPMKRALLLVVLAFGLDSFWENLDVGAA